MVLDERNVIEIRCTFCTPPNNEPNKWDYFASHTGLAAPAELTNDHGLAL